MAGWSVPGVVHLEQLGEDSVGRRVRARHRITRKHLIITYLSPEFATDAEFRARFRADWTGLAQVRDSRVARAHRYVEGDHGAAVITEHVTGTALRTLLLAQGALGTAAALVVLKDSLLALAACHKAGLAHGDIKPEDVILTHAGRVRLVDFGLWTSQGRRLFTRSTPFYLAPEQWGGAPVGPAGDVYAAAVTFFECLAGAPPFYADDTMALAVKHEVGTPPLDVVPELVRELVERGLSKDPGHRPGAGSLLTLLDEVAIRAAGSAWERRGRQELVALLANRSALPAAPTPSRHNNRVGSGYGRPVRLATVMGGALALAAGLSSPPLAVLPGISIFGSGGGPLPVLEFPEPDRGAVAVRAATNGPLADRVPAPAARVRTGTPPLAPALSAPNVQTAPYVQGTPDGRHPGGVGFPNGASPEHTTPGQVSSETSACARSLVGEDKPCTAVHPEQPTPGSAGSTTDPSEVSIPVSLPVPVPVSADVPVQLPVKVPVQRPAPVQRLAPAQPPVTAPSSIRLRGQTAPGAGKDIHVSKDFHAQFDSSRSRKTMRADRSESVGNSVGQPTSRPHREFGNFSSARNSGER